MTHAALKQVRSEALALNETERAELARDLIASLDGIADADAATAWDSEILRRLGQIEDGTAPFVDRTELSRRLRRRGTSP